MATTDRKAVEAATSPRRLRLRYPATCSVCGMSLPPRTEAIWNSETKQATCLACDGRTEPTSGEAGGSAAAKAEQLATKAVGRARRDWGEAAAAVAATMVQDEPSVRAWEKGGIGESRLAAYVEREVGDAVIALHDRVIPGTRASNIDHLFVAPTGVWVVDAKSYKGKVEKRDVGPFWREELELVVNGRNRTKLVDGLAKQLKAVRVALDADPAYGQFDLHPVLCFVDSEWGVFARPFAVRGVTVLYPGALRDRLRREGNLTRPEMERLASRLALSLPAAR